MKTKEEVIDGIVARFRSEMEHLWENGYLTGIEESKTDKVIRLGDEVVLYDDDDESLKGVVIAVHYNTVDDTEDYDVLWSNNIIGTRFGRNELKRTGVKYDFVSEVLSKMKKP